jgi:putative ABC transport system permease protein
MSAILLTPFDLLMASLLLFLDAALSAAFRLDLHRQIFWAAFRMVVQLLGVGYILHFIFRLNNVAATTAIIVVMALIAAREVAARPRHRLGKPEGYLISSVSVLLATFLTAGLQSQRRSARHPGIILAMPFH